MKHIIKKVEYITADTKVVVKGEIETNNIELTRQELRQCVKCDRVLLVYDSIREK